MAKAEASPTATAKNVFAMSRTSFAVAVALASAYAIFKLSFGV